MAFLICKLVYFKLQNLARTLKNINWVALAFKKNSAKKYNSTSTHILQNFWRWLVYGR
jgi:hypothetical protein